MVRKAGAGESGLPALSVSCMLLTWELDGPVWRRVIEVRVGDKGCSKGSLLDPGGLGGGGEGLLAGALPVVLVRAGCLGMGVGMGAPVDVVLSLVMR